MSELQEPATAAQPSGPEGIIRAFIALNLPPLVKERLREIQKELKRGQGGAAARWTPVEQIHLTLRFLGNVPGGSVPDILAAMRSACAGQPHFELRTGAPGCFPSERKPRIIWVGVGGAVESLSRLQEAVAQETGEWGEREDRPYHAHLTIGRVGKRDSRGSSHLGVALSKAAPGRTVAWRVEQVDLMQSRLEPAGATYTVLGRVPIGEADNDGVTKRGEQT
jgi:2'-5' RNA ligase